jgi:hypothetical protein
LYLLTWGNKTSGISPSLLFPKAFFLIMAGLLAYSFSGAFPSRLRRNSDILPENTEITAAGTAPVFHRIPFLKEPFSRQR